MCSASSNGLPIVCRSNGRHDRDAHSKQTKNPSTMDNGSPANALRSPQNGSKAGPILHRSPDVIPWQASPHVTPWPAPSRPSKPESVTPWSGMPSKTNLFENQDLSVEKDSIPDQGRREIQTKAGSQSVTQKAVPPKNRPAAFPEHSALCAAESSLPAVMSESPGTLAGEEQRSTSLADLVRQDHCI